MDIILGIVALLGPFCVLLVLGIGLCWGSTRLLRTTVRVVRDAWQAALPPPQAAAVPRGGESPEVWRCRCGQPWPLAQPFCWRCHAAKPRGEPPPSPGS